MYQPLQRRNYIATITTEELHTRSISTITTEQLHTDHCNGRTIYQPLRRRNYIPTIATEGLYTQYRWNPIMYIFAIFVGCISYVVGLFILTYIRFLGEATAFYDRGID